MHRFEQRGKAPFGVGVRRRRLPDRACQRSTKVGQDVAEEIGAHHDVEPVRVLHKVRTQDVDVELVLSHVRTCLADCRDVLVSPAHGEGDAFDLVAPVRCFFGRERASVIALQRIRSTPRRVNTLSWTTNSRSVPANIRSPTGEDSPSVFSRTTMTSMSSGPRPARGLRMPGSKQTGRRFTYWSKLRRIGINRPQSETWSGTPGQPTAPRKIPSASRRRSRASSGISAPVVSEGPQDQSYSVQSKEKPKRRPAASSTRAPSGTISRPMPSPGITAMA